jgi:hypothetical protein
MSQRKHTKIGGYKALPVLEFTPRQLEVVKKGLVFFAESLQHSQANLPHIGLARLNYVTVLNKATRMLSEGITVRFDYNELVIISACLDMVLIDASFMAEAVDFDIALHLNETVKDQLAKSPNPGKSLTRR